jgi:hypothetical protein
MSSAQLAVKNGVPASPVNTTLKLCRTIAKLERRVRQLEEASHA